MARLQLRQQQPRHLQRPHRAAALRRRRHGRRWRVTDRPTADRDNHATQKETGTLLDWTKSTGCSLPPRIPTDRGYTPAPRGPEWLITKPGPRGPLILITPPTPEFILLLIRITKDPVRGPVDWLTDIQKTPPANQGPQINCNSGGGGSFPTGSGGGLAIPDATRLTPQEQVTGGRLLRSPNYTGGHLSESEDEDYDYVDQYGRTYDAIGGEEVFDPKFHRTSTFLAALDEHVRNQGLNFTVLDTTGATIGQADAIFNHILQYTPAQQRTIVWVWE